MNALESIYTALKNALMGQVWEDRIFAENAPATAMRPYVVFFWAGGGEVNDVRNNDPEFVISVKAVADNMQESMSMADTLSALINDGGLYDGGVIVGDSEWDILTITQDRAIHMKEMFEGATPIYHDGYQFNVTMEAK